MGFPGPQGRHPQPVCSERLCPEQCVPLVSAPTPTARHHFLCRLPSCSGQQWLVKQLWGTWQDSPSPTTPIHIPHHLRAAKVATPEAGWALRTWDPLVKGMRGSEPMTFIPVPLLTPG